ncbi:pyridoxamine 5'-phosphate oxidase family protein [Fodinicola acaciae]|uniref:pyridoxamine 5'-phosphate oxidase family protein n=1 Tax=Fodinicola acaciae TaxID=2681555 RepID=UPI0013D22445|nr:pyridoxamine 5'-phosphate oxidase family protein [Fodinicola acaciae]
MFDTEGLQELEAAECLRLLAGAGLGRVVLTERAMPAVQVVNFAMYRGEVVIRTSDGGKLAAATANAVVGFEVDEFATDLRAGWSVVVVGQASEVSDENELRDVRDLHVRTWMPLADDRFIRIRPQIVNGRRLPA